MLDKEPKLILKAQPLPNSICNTFKTKNNMEYLFNLIDQSTALKVLITILIMLIVLRIIIGVFISVSYYHEKNDIENKE